MKKSAKSPTRARGEVKALAKSRFRDGVSAAEVARELGVPRTTVIGWWRKWNEDRSVTVAGRPRRLAVFNEHQVLGELINLRQVQGWATVRAAIRRVTGEQLSRRTVFRLLRRWEIAVDGSPLRGGGFGISGQEWRQPQETVVPTVVRSGQGRTAWLWRIFHRGRMAGFVFGDESNPSIREAASEIWQWAVQRSKRGMPEIHTSHQTLQQALRNLESAGARQARAGRSGRRR